MPTDRDYADSMELVESVMEWIGMRWTVSMIKRELREYFGKDLSFLTCNYLIKAANKEIRKRFNIDPQHYKGIQIEFYESIIRNKHEKTKNQLTAAERLDKLFGLEQVTGDDPEVQARKIREALKEMDESIGEQDGGDEKNIKENKQGIEKDMQDVGDRKNDNGGHTSSEATITKEDTTTERIKTGDDLQGVAEVDVPTEDESISPETIEELKNLKDEDFKRFRKSKG